MSTLIWRPATPAEREPIEVRVSPDELVVVSYPGPDRSISMSDLRARRAVSRRCRNGRIGEFLKELDLTEGRATGIPKILKEMAGNGSPPPCLRPTLIERLSSSGCRCTQARARPGKSPRKYAGSSRP